MKKSKGYILIILLCVNMWLGIVSMLVLQVVGLARYISVKHMIGYNDARRFDILIDLAKKYIGANQNQTILEGTIFTDDIIIDGIDTFKGRIDILLTKKQYIAEITIYINGKEKTIKKNL